MDMLWKYQSLYLQSEWLDATSADWQSDIVSTIDHLNMTSGIAKCELIFWNGKLYLVKFLSIYTLIAFLENSLYIKSL